MTMPELAAPLRRALERTGYLTGAGPAAATVRLAEDGDMARPASFEPEAWWRSNPDATARHGGADLKVYFKFVAEPDAAPAAAWQQEVWNQGFCPLLWLVSPQRIDIYNGFGQPRPPADAARNRLDTFRLVDAELARLDRLAGRLAMETGQFWRQRPDVNRASAVDGQLLRDLAALKGDLEAAGLAAASAQALIGRSIFTQYLIDRRIVSPERLGQISGYGAFPDVLQDRTATARLFEWLRDTFNGDMFPSGAPVPAARHLGRVHDFLTATEPRTGQRSLFPYRFDVIPVELISAIYEQFVHSEGSSGKQADVHYTPLSAVSLVLDEVFAGLTGAETVLDLTCGSGVFLVEALRRLVHLQAGGGVPTRAAVRRTLREQVYGVDRSPEAVSIAAFSLYLAALELDPDPRAADGLRFQPLVGRTLRAGDAFDVDPDGRKFDLIVGNPPWSYQGQAASAARWRRAAGEPRSPRGRSLDFVRRAMDFGHDRTRFGMIVSATPFFSRSATGLAAAQSLVEALGPVTLVNLAELSGWLFPKADMPALALLARCGEQRTDRMTLVQARWSPAGERSRTIEIAPSDVTSLPLASWRRNPALFKAAFLGNRYDLLLLDDLRDKQETLDARLGAIRAKLVTGMIAGNRNRDATFLKGMPFAQRGIGHFTMPAVLLRFGDDFAEGPRTIDAYRAPVLLIKEFLLKETPRLVVAVAEQDTVYSDSYFGVSFSESGPDAAHLVAGILGSALATWYYLMSGSAFGLWLRRVKRADVAALPTPDLGASLGCAAGKRIVRMARALHDRAPNDDDWRSLDDAVFDLYGLDEEDRIVVQDGLERARSQWLAGRRASVAPTDEADLKAYARAFLSSMDAWLSDRPRLRAEIYRLPPDAPLRVIRFVLEEGPGPSTEVKLITPAEDLSDVLARIGSRAKVGITPDLIGLRDLRVHATNEVSIIKPATRRNWLRVYALDDADQTVQDTVDSDGAE